MVTSLQSPAAFSSGLRVGSRRKPVPWIKRVDCCLHMHRPRGAEKLGHQAHESCELIPTICDPNFLGTIGKNSWLFQGAASTWVDRMLDLAFSQRQSFILDGTLSDLDRARRNIERCLRHGRAVKILYVYQDPLLAWRFVQAREAEEGRHISTERFIEIYFQAREVVNALKAEFGPNVSVDLLFKPNDNTAKLSRVGIDRIDYHVPERYTREELAGYWQFKGSHAVL